MIFTIPGTGSSGHLCGGMLLSALLGPYAGFLTMIGVLLTQCLLFAGGRIICDGPTKDILTDKELLEANGLELPLRLQNMQ